MKAEVRSLVITPSKCGTICKMVPRCLTNSQPHLLTTSYSLTDFSLTHVLTPPGRHRTALAAVQRQRGTHPAVGLRCAALEESGVALRGCSLAACRGGWSVGDRLQRPHEIA